MANKFVTVHCNTVKQVIIGRMALTWEDVGKSVFGLVIWQFGHIRGSSWVIADRLIEQEE